MGASGSKDGSSNGQKQSRFVKTEQRPLVSSYLKSMTFLSDTKSQTLTRNPPIQTPYYRPLTYPQPQRWALSYKDVHRHPILGVVDSPTQPPLIELDRDNTPPINIKDLTKRCEEYKNDCKNIIEDLEQFRIKSRAAECIKDKEQEAHEAKLGRYYEEYKDRFESQTPSSQSSYIFSVLTVEEKLESYKRNDQKYFPKPRKFPELTPEILEEVEKALKPYPEGETLVEIDGAQILRKDIHTLRGLNWLNDEIINAYMSLLILRGQHPKYKNVYSFNTFFYPKLRDSGYASVKRWTRKFDIFSYDYILVPVHLGNHWCLAMINFITKQIQYYDSMGGGPGRCCDILLNYLKEEMKDKKKQDFDEENWTSKDCYHQGGIPHQMNCSDCGVFACTYAEYLTREKKFDFEQKDMPYFRKKMIYEIIKRKILE